LQDVTCVNGLLCSFSQCIQGGQPDLFCVINCFNGDIAAALNALAAVTCIATTCGTECAGGLGL
jgi:hypothetical protein